MDIKRYVLIYITISNNLGSYLNNKAEEFAYLVNLEPTYNTNNSSTCIKELQKQYAIMLAKQCPQPNC